ncbi:MAG: DDE-type integrase/transposase/recombinase [Nannocystis sp.]|nr:DDE-type integrase/transposase/recombinase [Nannocystis sp.]
MRLAASTRAAPSARWPRDGQADHPRDGQAELSRSYRELARHYGVQIDPTPPASPQMKGRVESAVRYIRRNFLPTLGAGKRLGWVAHLVMKSCRPA